jgi:hypothetical protein
MIITKTFILPKNSTISHDILRGYINLFWKEVYKPLHNKDINMHLLLLCKVQFTDSNEGYKTLADLRKVNFNDKEMFIEYLIGRLGYLSDSYQVNPVSKLLFTYIVKDGIANDTRLLLNNPVYEVTTHKFNNMQVPLTMDPFKYGEIIAEQEFTNDNKNRYVVRNNLQIFVIDINKDATINNVHIQGAVDIKWTDIKISDTIFKRNIGKNTLYIKDGIIIVKEKQLTAKPFRKVKIDSALAANNFLTIDIETVIVDGNLKPYLICGYSNEGYIHSYAKDLSEVAIKQMFTKFIDQVICIKNLKYIYAHNLSGFDGIFLLKHLINYEGAKVKPIIFNGKIMGIDFIVNEGKSTIKFKDSFLLLPHSLRSLCKSFDVFNLKGYFPFNMTDINYVGEFPSYDLWTGLNQDEYDSLRNQFHFHSKYSNNDSLWSFKDEAIKYCQNDCKCLFDVLIKFNELVFIKFKVNIHSSLTLPSLAMRIYKSQYMPDNTIYQILGKVEQDIRQAYTGGAVDVYLPHNGENKNFHSRNKEQLFLYDVNNLYPSVMANTSMPVGKPIAFEGNILEVEKEPYGFFYCKLTSPDYMEHPILQRRVKTSSGIRTIAGLGTWEGWIYSHELINAIKNGYKFEIIKGYKFKRGVIFKEYVEDLYSLRMQYPKDNPMNMICKLLLNSLYGKFGMKSESSEVELYDTSNEEDMKHLQFILDEYGEFISDYIKLDNFFITVRPGIANYKFDESKDLYHGLDVNIAIASAITAGGRILMSQIKNDPNIRLYYSDTDSAVTNKPLPDYLVGDKLGQFKLEHVIREAVFLAPKVYGFITTEGREIIKVKGVTKEALYNTHITDLEKLLLKDSSVVYTQQKWFKNVFEGQISVSDVAYHLKVTSNKRYPIYRGGIFTDTAPYNYNEIEIKD